MPAPMSAESANATSQAAQHKVHPHQDNQQLLAYQRKYDEEYEGFKKLAAKLQASIGQQGSMLGPPSTSGAQLPDSLLSSSLEQQQQPMSPSQKPHLQQQLAAAIQKAEALLAEVHAAAVQVLAADDAVLMPLLAKQLRLQRNQAFEAAKALLHKAHASEG